MTRTLLDAMVEGARALGDLGDHVRWYHPAALMAPLVRLEPLERVHVEQVERAFSEVMSEVVGWEVAYQGFAWEDAGDGCRWLSVKVAAELDFVAKALERLEGLIGEQLVRATVVAEPVIHVGLAIGDHPFEDTLPADPERVLGQEYSSDVVFSELTQRTAGEEHRRLAALPLSRR
jgi:hypothetical protein